MDLQDLADFRKVFLLPTALGFFPFTFVSGKPRLSKRLVVYGLLLRAVFGLARVLVPPDTRKLPKRGGPIDTWPTYAVYINHIFILWLYVFFLLKSSSFKSALNICVQVEKDLLKFKVKFSRTKSTPFVLLFLFSLVPLVVHACSIPFRVGELIALLLHSYLNISVLIGVYLFGRMLGIIRTRFRNLNEALTLLANVQYDAQKTPKIVNLTKLHCRLHEACRLLNIVFNQQLLVFYLTFFIYVVVCCYFMAEAFFANELSAWPIMNVANTVFQCSIAYLFVYQSINASQEAKEFKTILYQAMVDDGTNELSSNKNLRLHIAMKREVVFSACGFFNIDYTLLHTIITAAATYLVILIQFGGPRAPGFARVTTNQPDTTLPFNVTEPFE